MPTFNHEGHYVCDCGREFTKAQSYNAHLSHCNVHLGDDKYELQHQNRQVKGFKSANCKKHNNYVKKCLEDESIWSKSPHYCENCGKKLIVKYATGRFCCSDCARSYSTKHIVTFENIETGNYGTLAVKKFILKYGLKQNKCELCGISEWNGKSITCQLHHIDGNNKNNKLENLQMLCPNCHSQTESYSKQKRK